VPEHVADTIERIAFLARADRRIDQRSGVSQRMPISVLENAVSNAERRALVGNELAAVPRPSDIHAALPSITGKLELEYEGELIGAERIARDLIAAAAKETFEAWGGEAVADSLEEVVDYFERGGVLQIGDTAAAAASLAGFRTVPGLVDAVTAMGLARSDSPGHTVAACELLLEALVADKRISRSESGSYARAPRRRPPDGPPKPTFEV
jgi:magnesium chelatase subunit I